jgi:hypothetical protein
MAHRTVSLSAEQARWFRIRRSGLDRPFATAELAATALVGVQAQILPAAGLALWNRSVGLTNAAFEDALFNRRSLVKLWGQRNTLHIYTSTDWPLLCAARALNRTWWERSVENGSSEFADYRHLVEEVAALLRQRESMGRSDLRASGIDLHEELYSAWGGIFADLVRLGYACHAGRDGSEGRFAHRERWLPDLAWNPPDPQAANLEVARRFFAAYGPASATDFAYWRGGSTPLARGWVSALHDSLCIVAVDGQSMLALAVDVDDLSATPPAAEQWPVHLLYRFDPLLLGHKDKQWVADAEHYKRIWRPAGHIEGIVLAHGRAVATWRYDRTGTGIAVTVAPFRALPAHVHTAVVSHAQGVADFFGLPLVEMRIGEDKMHHPVFAHPSHTT